MAKHQPASFLLSSETTESWNLQELTGKGKLRLLYITKMTKLLFPALLRSGSSLPFPLCNWFHLAKSVPRLSKKQCHHDIRTHFAFMTARQCRIRILLVSTGAFIFMAKIKVLKINVCIDIEVKPLKWHPELSSSTAGGWPVLYSALCNNFTTKKVQHFFFRSVLSGILNICHMEMIFLAFSLWEKNLVGSDMFRLGRSLLETFFCCASQPLFSLKRWPSSCRCWVLWWSLVSAWVHYIVLYHLVPWERGLSETGKLYTHNRESHHATRTELSAMQSACITLKEGSLKEEVQDFKLHSVFSGKPMQKAEKWVYIL